jgi:conjugal transfer pilus assembly protein TraF
MIPIIYSLLAVAAPWYEQKLEGWYYFQEKEKERELTPEEANEIVSEERENLQALRALAILIPTEENVSRYIEAERQWSDQSSRFAETWAQVSEPATEDPFSQIGERAFLLMCFNGEDPSSISAAETAEAFAKLHGWKWKAISLDGKMIPGLTAEKDRGISQALDVTEVPAFFIIDLEGNQIYPVGEGTMPLEELENKILRL